MMKKIYLFATAALMFAACSSDDLSLNNEQQVADIDDGVVRFDAYQQRGTTRSGLIGDLSLTNLQGNAANFGGFGVFGFYTDNKDYDQLATPNFFYNQQVIWKLDGTNETWQYEPVKYWPNEYGSNAQSDDADRVSFFAYAPFVNVIASTGKTADPTDAQKNTYNDAKTTYTTAFNTYKSACDAYEEVLLGYVNGTKTTSDVTTAKTTYDDKYTTYATALSTWKDAQKAYNAAGGSDLGITGMTRNTASGDPIVKYIGSFSSLKAVDLCWGVCEQSDWTKVQDGQAQQFTLGKPWLDVQRPASTAQRLKFQFKHALAKMQITVDEFKDNYKANGNMPDETRIWIRSVRFKGFTMKGALNLNNETAGKPYWMNYNGIGDLEADDEVIIYDGRKDGKEGVSGSIATNEKTLGLNPQFVENEEAYIYGSTKSIWNDINEHLGVTATATQLFEDGGVFYVIPTDDAMEVEIVYDVETIVPGLGVTLSDGKTAGSSIENRISKTIKFGADDSKLEAGKAYTIKLHLGMNSVKFDAAVVDWEDMATPDIDLPRNMPSYAAATAMGTLTIPGAATEFYFAVTGLKGGENVTGAVKGTAPFAAGTVEVSSTGDFTSPDSRANASGVAYVKVSGSYTTNNTILDVTTDDAIIITGAQSSECKLNVIQKAQPLALSAPTNVVAAQSYTLVSPRDISDWQVAATGGTPAASIDVWCDGAKLTVRDQSTDPSSEAEVAFDKSAGTLIFTSPRLAGQTIKVTIKAGDVPAETISFTVPEKLTFVPSKISLPYKAPTGEWDVAGYLKYTTGTITWTNSGTYSSTVSESKISNMNVGDVITITATDNMKTANDDTDDVPATIEVTIVKQPYEFVGLTTSAPVSSGTLTVGSLITNLSTGLSFRGTIDQDVTAGTLSYECTSAKDDSDNDITINANSDGTVTAGQNLTTGTYTIVIKITATPTDNTNYEKVEETVTITLTVS